MIYLCQRNRNGTRKTDMRINRFLFLFFLFIYIRIYEHIYMYIFLWDDYNPSSSSFLPLSTSLSPSSQRKMAKFRIVWSRFGRRSDLQLSNLRCRGNDISWIMTGVQVFWHHSQLSGSESPPRNQHTRKENKSKVDWNSNIMTALDLRRPIWASCAIIRTPQCRTSVSLQLLYLNWSTLLFRLFINWLDELY